MMPKYTDYSGGVAETILTFLMGMGVGVFLSVFITLIVWSNSVDSMIKRGFYVYGNTIYVVEPMKTVDIP